MTGADVTVAYIGGSGRSGSTLLVRLLGSLDGVISVGELAYVWNYGLINNNLCGCGQPFRECDFWRAVFDEAFGGFDGIDAHRMQTLQRKTHRWRDAPFLASRSLRPDAFQKRVSEY